MRVLQYHLVPCCDWAIKKNGDYSDTKKVKWSEMYESTNLILADSYGELEQLCHRRQDIDFLHAYLKHLQTVAEFKREPHTKISAPEALCLMEGKEIIRAWVEHTKFLNSHSFRNDD
jgi:hypothetical protein